MVVGLLGNKSPDSNRFTLVTPKSLNDVRLQATLGNQNPTGLPVGAVSMKQNINMKIMISSVCIFSLSCTSVQPVSSSGCVHDKAIHKISILSDTHLQTGNMSDGISYINAWNQEIIEAALDQIDADDTDLLILCGDNTNSGKKEEHKELISLLKETNADVIVVPGNHDLGMTKADEFEDMYRMYGYSTAFSKDDASLSYCAVYDNVMIVVLDTNQDADGKTGIPEFTEHTFDWLEQQLQYAQQENLAVICAGHYPLITRQSGEFTQKKRIARLLNRYEVHLYVCGHLHYHAVNDNGNLKEAVVSQTTSYPISYITIEMNEDVMDVSSVAVDVESWAKNNRRKETELLNFDSYLQTRFARKCEDVVSVLVEGKEISKADLLLAQDLFFKVMKYRSDGTLYRHKEEIRNHNGYSIFLKISEGTIWNEWIPLVLVEANPDTEGFSVDLKP